MISIGATAVIIQDNKVLLVKREDFEVWALPGGGVDEGESLAETAVREAYEETGLQVEITHLIALYSEIGSWSDWHLASFAAKIVGGSLNSQIGEVLDLQFFPLDELPEDMFWWHRQHIADFLAGPGSAPARRQNVHSQPGATNRAELYAMRDQSGLTRTEFYHWYYKTSP
ncbi:MAG: NUDIX domain-containing protein [Candidatus Promineifilaceae bacterium]|nr:NUDIX domain-containing protein [Anaerolineaceae bacterium]